MAELLRKEPDTQVNLVDGSRGEFTVLVDGREVASKQGDNLPDEQQILNAVRSATAGAHA